MRKTNLGLHSRILTFYSSKILETGVWGLGFGVWGLGFGCLIEAEQSLCAITGGQTGAFKTRAEKDMGRLRAELDYTDVKDIFEIGLHEYLDQFQTKLNNLGFAIAETFFTDAVLN